MFRLVRLGRGVHEQRTGLAGSQPSFQRFYAPSFQVAGNLVLSGLFGAGLMAGCLFGGGPLVARIAFGLPAAMLMFLVVRVWFRAGIRVISGGENGDEVVVTNLIFTYSIEAGRIAEISELGRVRLSLGGIVVLSDDGQRVTCPYIYGLARSNPPMTIASHVVKLKAWPGFVIGHDLRRPARSEAAAFRRRLLGTKFRCSLH